jgi:hypothetical protein
MRALNELINYRCFFAREALARFFGTFAPRALASDMPMAIACERFVTFFLLVPLLSVPDFHSRITREIFFFAFGPYWFISL